MCLAIAAIGLALSVAGTLATASMQSSVAKQQAVIEQTQLKQEMENERIKAIGATNDRLEELRRAEATNRAALSTSGVDSWSYAYGIMPANREVMKRDVSRTEFNAGQEIGRKKYEIAVSGWKAKTDSRMAWVQAGGDIIGRVGNFAARSSSASSGGSIRPA